ncbi:MAG: hypothetical protein O2877_01335 [bacterium]|nr:hypothetical protein [bacterium]
MKKRFLFFLLVAGIVLTQSSAAFASPGNPFSVTVTSVEAIDASGNPDQTVRTFGLRFNESYKSYSIEIFDEASPTPHASMTQLVAGGAPGDVHISPSWMNTFSELLLPSHNYRYMVTAVSIGGETDSAGGTFQTDPFFAVWVTSIDEVDEFGNDAENVRSFGLEFSDDYSFYSIEIFEAGILYTEFRQAVTGTSPHSLYLSPGAFNPRELNPNKEYCYSVNATSTDGLETSEYKGCFETGDFGSPSANNSQQQNDSQDDSTANDSTHGDTTGGAADDGTTSDDLTHGDGTSDGNDDGTTDGGTSDGDLTHDDGTTSNDDNLTHGQGTADHPTEDRQRNERETEVVKREKSLVVKHDKELAKRVAGRILLQTEGNGEAWYVEPESESKVYLADGDSAYTALREFGLGISNTDIDRIPIGLEERFEELDSDKDGLGDDLERALGTNPHERDSDRDTFDDGTEVKNGFDPLREGRPDIDSALASRLEGRILLQVEGRGEAWYINPDDGHRYYMSDGDAAYQVMRFLSLGVTNDDLRKINVRDLTHGDGTSGDGTTSNGDGTSNGDLTHGDGTSGDGTTSNGDGTSNGDLTHR